MTCCINSPQEYIPECPFKNFLWRNDPRFSSFSHKIYIYVGTKNEGHFVRGHFWKDILHCYRTGSVRITNMKLSFISFKLSQCFLLVICRSNDWLTMLPQDNSSVLHNVQSDVDDLYLVLAIFLPEYHLNQVFPTKNMKLCWVTRHFYWNRIIEKSISAFIMKK